ncbi:hypothetical protein [Massilia sp. SYSU DXS3249]
MSFAFTPSAAGGPFGAYEEQRATPRIYTRSAFNALLDRQSESKVREALEDDNIPSCHKQDALNWLAARAAARQATHHF